MTPPRPARTSYQPLAWLEQFSDEPCEREAARMALDEIDRYRRGTHKLASATSRAREN